VVAPSIFDFQISQLNGTVTLTTPAGTAVDDLLVAVHQTAFRASSDLVSPSGTAGTWTQITTAIATGTGTVMLRAWYRPVTAGGAQTVTMAPPGSSNTNALGIYTLRGADLVTVVDGTPANNIGTTGTSHPVGPITTTMSDSLLIGGWGVYGGTPSYTAAPSGMSMAAGFGGSSSFSANNNVMCASQALTVSGTTATETPSVSGSSISSWGCILFAIQSQAAASVWLPSSRARFRAANW
jgi:hypothetical protein